jgi:hypothetical protein
MDDVIRRMRAIDAALPRADGVAVFNRVYRQVTERIRDELAGGGFADPPYMERLGADFAGLYLSAVRTPPPVPPPRAWRPLLAARRRPGVLPVQFALAGMNAHINHDLALAVVGACASTGRVPEQVRDDYDRVNGILASVVRPIRRSFLDAAVVTAGAPLSPAADAVSAWSIDTARDAAWVHANVLWQLRPLPGLAGGYRDTLDRTVGLVGKGLLVTPAPGP